MPLITVKTSVELEKESKEKIKEDFSRAIELIGKSESWLMVEFCDKSELYFRGSSEASAIIEVSLFGRATREGYDALTRELTDILARRTAVRPDRLYVRYSETEHWGYNGFNF